VGWKLLQRNSSNVNELLQKHLVTIDSEAEFFIEGKSKILVDEKPGRINASSNCKKCMESIPGSFIDKIEVMTNPYRCMHQ
jgi:hypothetical protein